LRLDPQAANRFDVRSQALRFFPAAYALPPTSQPLDSKAIQWTMRRDQWAVLPLSKNIQAILVTITSWAAEYARDG
jgi:hypothetical protein